MNYKVFLTLAVVLVISDIGKRISINCQLDEQILCENFNVMSFICSRVREDICSVFIGQRSQNTKS